MRRNVLLLRGALFSVWCHPLLVWARLKAGSTFQFLVRYCQLIRAQKPSGPAFINVRVPIELSGSCPGASGPLPDGAAGASGVRCDCGQQCCGCVRVVLLDLHGTHILPPQGLGNPGKLIWTWLLFPATSK